MATEDEIVLEDANSYVAVALVRKDGNVCHLEIGSTKYDDPVVLGLDTDSVEVLIKRLRKVLPPVNLELGTEERARPIPAAQEALDQAVPIIFSSTLGRIGAVNLLSDLVMLAISQFDLEYRKSILQQLVDSVAMKLHAPVH